MSATTPTRDAGAARRTGILGLALTAALLVLGLLWAKWLPYADRTGVLSETGAWPGPELFATAGEGSSLVGAWAFTVAYAAAVWKAVVVAVLLAAAVESLVPQGWLVRAVTRRTPVGQAVAAGTASLPSMMCSCCAAPIAVGLRRRGAPLGAVLAYWLGNPLLNPAVLVFLLLVLPWPYAFVRLVVGATLVLGVSVVLGRRLDRSRGAASLPEDLAGGVGTDPTTARELPMRYLRSLARYTLVLVPEYVAVVFLTGLAVGTLTDFAGAGARWGVLAVLVVALVGTALVVPTGGEIPVVAALAVSGSTLGLAGVLLITLPALSVPSMVMVARALSWRATLAAAASVAAAGVAAGGLLVLLL